MRLPRHTHACTCASRTRNVGVLSDARCREGASGRSNGLRMSRATTRLDRYVITNCRFPGVAHRRSPRRERQVLADARCHEGASSRSKWLRMSRATTRLDPSRQCHRPCHAEDPPRPAQCPSIAYQGGGQRPGRGFGGPLVNNLRPNAGRSVIGLDAEQGEIARILARFHRSSH